MTRAATELTAEMPFFKTNATFRIAERCPASSVATADQRGQRP
jgi:hypothetical protein